MRLKIGKSEYGIVPFAGQYHSFVDIDGTRVSLAPRNTQDEAVWWCEVHYYTLNSKPVELATGSFYIVDGDGNPLYLHHGVNNPNFPGPIKYKRR